MKDDLEGFRVQVYRVCNLAKVRGWVPCAGNAVCSLTSIRLHDFLLFSLFSCGFLNKQPRATDPPGRFLAHEMCVASFASASPYTKMEEPHPSLRRVLSDLGSLHLERRLCPSNDPARTFGSRAVSRVRLYSSKASHDGGRLELSLGAREIRFGIDISCSKRYAAFSLFSSLTT